MTWISVEERMPEEYNPVIVYSPNYGQVEAHLFDGDWKTLFGKWLMPRQVTHWRQRPEPPGEHSHILAEQQAWPPT